MDVYPLTKETGVSAAQLPSSGIQNDPVGCHSAAMETVLLFFSRIASGLF